MAVIYRETARREKVFRAGGAGTLLMIFAMTAMVFMFGCSRKADNAAVGKAPAKAQPLGKENIAENMQCPNGFYGYKDTAGKECCVLDADKTPLSRLQGEDMESLELLCVLGHIGDEGLAAIAASGHLSNVRELHLRDNDIGPRGVASLAESKSLPKLRQLHLEFNFISDEGAAIIANSATLKKLKGLNLTQNGIGDEGAKALAKSNMSDLRWMVLQRNEISNTGAMALINSKKLANLKILNLAKNKIKPNQKDNIKSKAPKGLKLVL